MFRFLQIIISLVILTALGVGIIYFLPSEQKEKIITSITGVVPEKLKKQVEGVTEEFLLTPPEKRAKILEKLEKSLSSAEAALADNAVSAAEAKILSETIASAEKQLEELKAKNNDASLTSIVTTKLVEQLLSKNASTTCAQ